MRSWGTSIVLATALTIAGCSGGDETTAPTDPVVTTTTTLAPRPDDGVLRLGVWLPRTGPGAPLGEPMIAAVEQAVTAINAAGGVLGGDVLLTVVDENSGTGLNELLDSGVDAIVGPASSSIALSQLGDAVQASTGVVVCSPSATAAALDQFPDNQLFFRTVPSDSLQMAAIARRVEVTGADQISVGHLDDPYGRGLADALAAELTNRGLIDIAATVGFSADQEDLTDVAAALLAPGPGVVVVLGDADDGTRLLAALDAVAPGDTADVIVNDALRDGRQAIQALSAEMRQRLAGVAAVAVSVSEDGPEGFFAANAADCVNLIALSALQADSDSPSRIKANMASVSDGGRACVSFADCAAKLGEGLQIDFDGRSGPVELSVTTGDLVRGRFEVFGFDDEGVGQALDGLVFEVE